MSADQNLDGEALECPVHGFLTAPTAISALGTAATALTDQEAARERELFAHRGHLHSDYFHALMSSNLPLELAAIMTREMASVYWNLELRR